MNPVMALVFAALLLALVVGRFGPRRLAIAFLLLFTALFVWQFLFEIYSPTDGFRMPWIRTEHVRTPAGA
ncbi:MAG: hypothetical protein AB7K35_08975 [Pseudorhodoplanes sp.]